MLVSVEEAVRRVEVGEVVAVPTDTVYGLAARVDDRAAIEAIFRMKRRPIDRPLTVLGGSIELFRGWVMAEYWGRFMRLGEAYWPGALTLVVPVVPGAVPEWVRRGRPTAGLRVPAHDTLLQLLERVGPLVNPSANRSGEPPARSLQELEECFGSNLAVLEGEVADAGQASTVVELLPAERWQLLRSGPVAESEIAYVLSQ